MKHTIVLVVVALVMVALLAPIAQASPPEDTPPLGQNVSGKYSCSGPEQTNPDGGTFHTVYSPLSKKEAEAGLASGAYVACAQNLPYQASS